MPIYCISDLHLSETSKDTLTLFLNFLTSQVKQSDELYILGDFFNVWVGDDHNPPYVRTIKATLSKLTKQGIPIFLMHGNRDFLIGNRFLKATGCQLIPDPYVAKFYGQNILLTHGDLLCYHDHAYQRFRTLVQHPLSQWLFLKFPLWLRLFIAYKIRQNSQKQQFKNTKKWKICKKIVAQILRKYKSTQMVHGHTHLPKVYNFTLDNAPSKRFILGNWHEHAEILICRQKDFKLHPLRVSL